MSTHHWIEDADLLERFVLDRVPAAERPALEAHLQACAQCREAVRKERLVAAGIRRAGREELRGRLASRTAGRVSPPRYRILAAAAIAVIAGGIALLGRWTSLQEETRQIPEETQLAAPADDSVRAGAEVTPAPEEPVHPSPASREQRRRASPPEMHSEKKERPALTAQAEHVLREMGTATETLPDGVWWSGVLTTGPAREDVEMEDAGTEPAGESVQPAPSGSGPVLVLHQKLTGEVAGRAKEGAPRSLDLPARLFVERRADTLRITLHIPRLLPAVWLEHPVVVGVAEDSLSLAIGGALLRVRVPEGTTAYGFVR